MVFYILQIVKVTPLNGWNTRIQLIAFNYPLAHHLRNYSALRHIIGLIFLSANERQGSPFHFLLIPMSECGLSAFTVMIYKQAAATEIEQFQKYKS